MTTSFSAMCSASAAPPRIVVDAQHHPLLDARLAVERRFERRVQLGQRHLGQEAEAAEVDAENRNVDARRADAVGHRQQRAVAAEHDDHVDVGDQRRLVGDAAGRRRRHQRGGGGLEDRLRCRARRATRSISARCGVAARRCDLATMPTRVTFGTALIVPRARASIALMIATSARVDRAGDAEPVARARRPRRSCDRSRSACPSADPAASRRCCASAPKTSAIVVHEVDRRR